LTHDPSKHVRMLPPLLGERAGVRAELILVCRVAAETCDYSEFDSIKLDLYIVPPSIARDSAL